MKPATWIQGTLFDPPVASRSTGRRRPSKRTTVTISAEAIAAIKVGGIAGDRIIVEAVRAARPEARNVAVDLGGIRWTDPKTGQRIAFTTPDAVRHLLLSLPGGATPGPFRFMLGPDDRSAGTDTNAARGTPGGAG